MVRPTLLNSVFACLAFVPLAFAVPDARAQVAGEERIDAIQTGGVSKKEPEFNSNFTAADLGVATTPHALLSSVTVPATLQAIDRYAAIVSRGGWPTISDGPTLYSGSRDKRVLALRQRLTITGDLRKNAGNPRVYDADLEQAVRRFQYRHGLKLDGAVRGETLAALNVPALKRLQQLRTNVVRVNTFSTGLPDKYVLVNIPSAEIEAVENGMVARRHTAIVGRPDRQTPVLTSKIHELNFSPFWHVPQSIVERDIIPQMQKDPGYLKRYIIRVYHPRTGEEVDPATIDWHGEEAKKYRYRQDPGEDINALGAVKLNFSNPFAVFLHDTPKKDLFETNVRAYSSGCVRVKNVEDLLTWVLKDNDKEYWSRQKVDAVIGTGERINVGLRNPVPLNIVYITAWGRPNGLVHFRKDLYGRDTIDQTAQIGNN